MVELVCVPRGLLSRFREFESSALALYTSEYLYKYQGLRIRGSKRLYYSIKDNSDDIYYRPRRSMLTKTMTLEVLILLFQLPCFSHRGQQRGLSDFGSIIAAIHNLYRGFRSQIVQPLAHTNNMTYIREAYVATCKQSRNYTNTATNNKSRLTETLLSHTRLKSS